MSTQTDHPHTANGTDSTSYIDVEVDGALDRSIANGATVSDEANNSGPHNEPYNAHRNDLRHDPEDFGDAGVSAIPTAESSGPRDAVTKGQPEALVPERQGQAQEDSGEALGARTELRSTAPKRIKRARPLCKSTGNELTKCRSIARYQLSKPLSRR